LLTVKPVAVKHSVLGIHN